MHYFRTILLPIGLLWLCACSSPPKQSLADYRPIDLTYTFDEKTIYWPTGKHFEHERGLLGTDPSWLLVQLLQPGRE